MDERKVISALLDSREAYDALSGRMARSDFSEFGQLVIKEVEAYYTADASTQAVDRGLVAEQIGRQFPTPEQSRAAVDFLESVPACSSPSNAARLYKSLRRYNIGLSLADNFVQGDHGGKTATLLKKYDDLATEDLTDWKPLLTVEDVFNDERKDKIKLYPKRLNDTLDGGPRAGETVLIFGRPGSGKTAVAINAVAGAMGKGHTVLYAGNEESQETLQRRFLSRMGRVKLAELNANGKRGERAWRLATSRACKKGLDNLNIVHGNLSLPDLENYVKTVRPDILVVDQLQHIDGGNENRTRTMENTMRTLRDWAHTYNMVVLTVCQAGASAEYQKVLRLTDIDFANTGVQGACEVMIGVGFDLEMQRTGKRLLTFCRNKVSGKEDVIPVWLDKQYTAIRNEPVERDYE
jgi:KaiC/GvpD/RAD55 family RecA-like ATPase